MNKIIINSSVLHRLLFGALTPLIPEPNDYEVSVKCIDGLLSIGNHERTLYVTTNSDFDMEIPISHLRRLFRILSTIEEQPITISFSYSYIELFNILI